jgi:hypothetical protein
MISPLLQASSNSSGLTVVDRSQLGKDFIPATTNYSSVENDKHCLKQNWISSSPWQFPINSGL